MCDRLVDRQDRRAERGEIQRVQHVGRSEGIDRERAVGRAIDAGGVGKGGAPDEGPWYRLSCRRWCTERAFAVQHAGWRECLDLGILGLGFGRAGSGERNHLAQHLDEETGKRQVRPRGVGGDMHHGDHAIAASLAGDYRRAVFERSPGLARKIGIGLGQDLAIDADVVADLCAEERTFPGEGGEFARGVPGEAAAECTPAATQADGRQLVGGRGESCAGKAQQNTAPLDEIGDLRRRLRVERADIRENEDREILCQQLADGVVRARARLADLGEG